MNLTRTILACSALSAASLVASPALAKDPDPGALFDRGVADMEAGKFDTGCPAIEQSYKIDPLPGTLFTLAECEAKRGRIATALGHYNDYLAIHGALSAQSKAKQGDREKVARAQREALGAEVPELTLVLPPNAPQGTTVTRDGIPVAKQDIGIPIRVDPGMHVIVTQAPGRPQSIARISLAARERRGIALVIAEPATTFVPQAGPEAPPPPRPANVGLIVGATSIGVGAVFAVIGTAAALKVNSLNNDSTYNAYRHSVPSGVDVCTASQPGGLNPNAAVVSDCSALKTFSALEFASFPLAAVFATVGIIMVAVNRPAPAQPPARVTLVPSVGPHSAGLGATLQF